MWVKRLRSVYTSKEEFESYCRVYGNHTRLGFDTPDDAWEANPRVQGSTDPADYKVVYR